MDSRWSIEFNVFHRDRGLDEFSRTKFERKEALARENQFPDHVALRAVATSIRGEPGLPPASFELTALTLGFGVCRGLSMALVIAGQSGLDWNLVVKDVSQR